MAIPFANEAGFSPWGKPYLHRHKHYLEGGVAGLAGAGAAAGAAAGAGVAAGGAAAGAAAGASAGLAGTAFGAAGGVGGAGGVSEKLISSTSKIRFAFAGIRGGFPNGP